MAASSTSARALLRATRQQLPPSVRRAAHCSGQAAPGVASSSRVQVAAGTLHDTKAASTSSKAHRPRSIHVSSYQAQQAQRRSDAATGASSSSSSPPSATPNTPAFNARLTPAAAKDVQSIQAWLRAAFPATPFPDDVALQLITHESYDHGVEAGHNRRLAFVGRRALKFYMSLFLAQRASAAPALDVSPAKVDTLLQTSRLGDHVGRLLKLADVMRWTPAVNDGQQGPKETGLFKIRGVTVEALIGAIYHQHGARAARSFFSAHILPSLSTFDTAEADTLRDAISQEKTAGEEHLRSMLANVSLEDKSSRASSRVTSEASLASHSPGDATRAVTPGIALEEAVSSTQEGVRMAASQPSADAGMAHEDENDGRQHVSLSASGMSSSARRRSASSRTSHGALDDDQAASAYPASAPAY